MNRPSLAARHLALSSNAQHMTYQQDIMVLRLGPQILEDTLRPKPLHMIPVLDHPMLYRIMQPVRLCVRNRLVPNEEIEIVNPPLGSEMSGLASDGRCTGRSGPCVCGRGGGLAAGCRGAAVCGDHGGEDERGFRVPRETGRGGRSDLHRNAGDTQTNPIFV
jgi:hypothetical protein